MHCSRIVSAGVLAFALSASDVSALQRGNGGGPKPRPVSSGPAVKAQSPKIQAPKGHTPKSHAPKTNGPKTQTPKGPSASADPAKTKTAKGASSTTTSTSERPSSTASRTEAGSTLSPVQQKLESNTKLAAKLSGRLPRGMDLMTAAEGFRNLGQFVAAVNVSNNLDIPFAQLKTRMVDDGMSLGQAIKDTRPSADSTLEARRALSAADVMIVDAEASQPKTKASKSASSKAKGSKSK